MTHDELLEKIRLKFFVNEEGATQSGFQESQLRNAVYAVVELHKPVKVNHNYYATEYGCSSDICQDKYDEPMEYPCQTIKVIEKGLQ